MPGLLNLNSLRPSQKHYFKTLKTKGLGVCVWGECELHKDQMMPRSLTAPCPHHHHHHLSSTKDFVILVKHHLPRGFTSLCSLSMYFHVDFCYSGSSFVSHLLHGSRPLICCPNPVSFPSASYDLHTDSPRAFSQLIRHPHVHKPSVTSYC